MQVAASNAASASTFGTGGACASGALPVGTEMKPPASMIRSNAVRSTTRSLTTGKARARHGSMSIVCAVGEVPHVQLAGGGGPFRTVRYAVDHHAAHAADALAAVVVEGDRVVAVEDQPLVEHVEHLQERHVRGDVGDLVGDHPAAVGRPGLAPDAQGQIHL